MKIDPDALWDACALWVLTKADEEGNKEGLTTQEILQAVQAMSEEERLDALARYQEHGS